MKKVRAAVLLIIIGVMTLAFSLGSGLPAALSALSGKKQVSAGSRFSPSFEQRFSYISPDWDMNQWYAQGGPGSYKLSSSREQYFNLQSQFFDGATGASVTGTTEKTRALTVFSSSDMHAIASGQAKVAVENQGQTWSEQEDKAAFVMLDDDAVNKNMVVLDFKNLTTVTSFEASFNGTPFRSFIPGNPNDFLTGVPSNMPVGESLFINMGREPGINLQDPRLYKYRLNDAKDIQDRVYWWNDADKGEFQIRGMFNREGYYEFRFNIAVWGANADRRITTRFGFYIGHINDYVNTEGASAKNMPVFDLDLKNKDSAGNPRVPTGEPLQKGLFRPSHTTASLVDAQGNLILDENGKRIPIPTNNDRFYYNYHDNFPTIQYKKDRYKVDVSLMDHNKVRHEIDSSNDGDHPVYTFNQLGMYTVNAEMRFQVTISGQAKPREMSVRNFAAHRYFLDVFGFQAQYWNMNKTPEQYDWFGNKDLSLNSDVTTEFVGDSDFVIDRGTKEDTPAQREAKRKASADNAIRKLIGVNGNPGKLDRIASPVVTNSPLVSLRYTASHAYADEETRTKPLTRVAYRKTHASEWTDPVDNPNPYGNPTFTEYSVGKPFEAAGEYAVIVFYEYDAAEGKQLDEGLNEKVGKIYSQVFYFKINNFAADILLRVGGSSGTSYSFADLMEQVVPVSQSIEVLYKSGNINSTSVGPFEIAPRIEVTYENFTRTQYELIPLNSLMFPTRKDGIYTFRVYYGNNTSKNHMPHMDFTVIVDTAPIKNFQCYQGGNPQNTGEIRNGTNVGAPVIPNVSVFGSGEVTLAWDRKESGVDMNVAKLDYYAFSSVEMCREKVCDGSTCGKFHHSAVASATLMQSQFNVSPVLSRSLRIVPTESGFRLGDKLTASGIYVITIVDAANVETTYLIVIDTTIASFAQVGTNDPLAGKIDPNKVNVKNVDTTVGFGSDKFVKAEAGVLTDFFTAMGKIEMQFGQTKVTFAQALVNSGFFVNDPAGSRFGFKAKIDLVEMSIDSINYMEVYNSGAPANAILVSAADSPWGAQIRNNHVQALPLNNSMSVTYFFRLTDRTHNTAAHYIELNPDVTKGIVFDDGVPNIFQGDNISRTATIVQADRISNRDYLTFSFEQTPRPASGASWHVDKVNIAFYPLTYQLEIMERDENGLPKTNPESGKIMYRDNINYPFSDTPEILELNAGADFGINEERIPININRTPRTRQGLYVIARICDNAPIATESNGRTNIRNYRFIVDNNPIISNKNFESGIYVKFGDASSAPIARYNDFQRLNNARMDPETDRVLRTNTSSTRVLLPGTRDGDSGSKYSRSWDFSSGKPTQFAMHNMFKIRKGDLLDNTNFESKVFASLDIKRAVEFRAMGTNTFVVQSKDHKGNLDLINSGMYRIAFTDGSGGFSWVLGADAPKPPDGNRSEMLIEYINEGPRGTFALNGRQVSPSSLSSNIHSVRLSDKNKDKLTFTYVVKDETNFLYEVVSLADPAYINSRAITWYPANNGTPENILREIRSNDENTNQQTLLSKRAIVYQYTVGAVTYCEVTLPLSAGQVRSGDRFTIELTNGLKTRTLELFLDNTPPKFNLNKITAGDAFWEDSATRRQILCAEGYHNHGVNPVCGTTRCTGCFGLYTCGICQICIDSGANASRSATQIVKTDGTIEIASGNSLRYPFRMENNFAFSIAQGVYAPENVYTLDTFSISYFEVDSRLSNISGERSLAYDNRTFSSVVNLQPNENRFFRIVERDEAGNRSDYFVQLRGNNYVDRIDASGIVEYRQRDAQSPARPTGRHVVDNFVSDGGTIRGYEMSVDNVRDFFANNLFFELEAGSSVIGKNILVRRLGFNTMSISGASGNIIGDSDGPATPERFAEAVQQMLEAGRGASKSIVGTGGAIRFKLNNRFKHTVGRTGGYSWEVRQITRSTGLFEVAEIQHASSEVTFAINDTLLPGDNQLPDGINGIRGSGNFIFEVYNLSDMNAGPITTRTTYGKRQTVIDDKYNEYLVVATDEYGRTVRYAHNGIYGSNMDLRYPLTMAERISNDLYVGGGVEVNFSTNAYDLEIFRDGVMVFRNGYLIDTTAKDYIKWDWDVFGDSSISLLPEDGKINRWNVVSYRRGTSTRWEREFFSYGELPTLRFMNQSGETLHGLENGGVTAGIVTVTYSFEGMLFGAGVEYTRTWKDENGIEHVEWHPISEYVTRYNFTREGNYVLTVTNALGFSSHPTRYVFTIDDVTNRSYKVFFDYGKIENGRKVYDELEASPIPYVFEPSGRNLSIPHFFVRNVNGTDVALVRDCEGCPCGACVSAQTRPLRIVPTTNSSRYIADDNGNHGRNLTSEGNTYIYQLISPTTNARVFLAVTLVPENVFTSAITNYYTITPGASIQEDDWGDQRFKVFGQASYRPDAALRFSLSRENIINNGNVLYLDYYRDGVWLGRLQGKQELVIHARDYGIYTLRVSDQAGNVLRFGTANYFTIIFLTRAPLYITESGSTSPAPIIDGMVYNDAVSLNVRELPFDISADPENFATRLRVYLNDIERTNWGYQAVSKEHARSSFSFSEPGRYRIELTYWLRGIQSEIRSEYNFIIASSTIAEQSFTYVAPRDTEITSIRVNGTEIRTRFPDVFLSQILLNTATGAGEYVITLRQGKDSIHQQERTRTFKVVVRSLPDVGVRASIGYGTSTTKSVELTIIPRQLYGVFGECRVIVLRDGSEVTNQIIGTLGSISLVSDRVSLFKEDEPLSDVGKYRVYVAAVDATVSDGAVVGTVYFSQGFQITKAQSGLATMIIVVVIIGLVGIAIFFIRLRMGVRTR